MSTKILDEIELYIKLKPESEKLDSEEIQNNKKRFLEFLNEYIDFRVEAILNEKQSSINNINSTLLNKPNDIINILNVLSAVPVPPDLDTNIDLWLITYLDWYENYYKPIIKLTEYNDDTITDVDNKS